MTRARTKSEEIESRLTTAALDVLAHEGPHALSIRRVAAAAGVAPMGIYARFTSKSGLIDHLLGVGFARLRSALAVTALSPTEALVACGRAYRAFALENPDLYRLMFARSASALRHDMGLDAAAEAVAAFGTLESHVRALEVSLDAHAVPTVDSAMLFWSVVHGFVHLELEDKHFSENRDGNFDDLLRVTVSGMSQHIHQRSSH